MIRDLFRIDASFVFAWRRRDLFYQLVNRNVQSRYRGSMLGLAWSFIQPLLMLCIYTFVFSIVFKAKFGSIPNDDRMAFAVILFAGMAVFAVFSDSLNGSCYLISGNENYVKRVVFPLELLPMAHVAGVAINTVPSFILVLVGMAFCGSPFQFSWTLLLLPVAIVPLWLLSLGGAFFFASLSVYIRDLAYVVNLFTQILFFMTPIFYPIEAVPERYRWILQFNPLSLLVENTRSLMLYGQIPDWRFCLVSFLSALLLYQLGYIWFVKSKKGFADVL